MNGKAQAQAWSGKTGTSVNTSDSTDSVDDTAAADDATTPDDASAGATTAPAEPIRVWAEAQAADRVLLTWEAPESRGINRVAGNRAIVALLEVQHGVSAVEALEAGLRVTFDPALTTPPDLAAALRSALEQPDLTSRLREVLTRGPSYLTLARNASMDDRVSPLQEIRRQSLQRNSSPAAAVTRFVPGAQLITRAQTLVPVLQALSSWSRDASPEVVQEHFAAAGLERTQLDRDLATVREAGNAVKDVALNGMQRTRGRFREAAALARSRFNEELHRDDEPTPTA